MAVELPKTFALKSNHNNRYLACLKDEAGGHGLVKFSGTEVSEVTLFHAEKAKSGNGLVHLKSSYNNKYLRGWSQNHYWIAAEADAPEEDQSKPSCTLFKPQFKDGDSKTLQLLLPVNQKELAHEPFTDLLSSAVQNNFLKNLNAFTLVNYVVVSKEITGIRLNLKDAKITSQTTVTDFPKAIVRNVSDKSSEGVIKLDYNKSESSTWILGSVSVNPEIITNIRSAIPIILNGNIELTGDEFSGPYQWGTPVETTNRVQISYKVNVPPKTILIVAPEATRATFEVPFSYILQDNLQDGATSSSSNKEDGIYRGVSLFNFRYQARQDKTR